MLKGVNAGLSFQSSKFPDCMNERKAIGPMLQKVSLILSHKYLTPVFVDNRFFLI